MATVTNKIVIEEGKIFGYEVSGYEDFTEIQYFEFDEKGKRVDKGDVIEIGAGELTRKLAEAMLKVNIEEE
jgi:hypothetical protein